MWLDLGKPTLWGLLLIWVWAKICTQLTYHALSGDHSTKKYYPLLSSWCWSDAHTSPHLFRQSISFGPLVLPLIVCNGEMLTWCQCYYGNNSGSTSVSVFQLVCSHNQTALQVALDSSTLFQEDSRITVNHQQTIQHTLWPVGGHVCKSHDCKRLHAEIIATQSLCNRTHCISKHGFASAVIKVGYNFAMQMSIREFDCTNRCTIKCAFWWY